MLPPFVVLLAVSLFGLFPVPARGQTFPEYQLKAAFIGQLFRFVDWPEDFSPDPDGKLIVGIIGDDPFGADFDELRGRRILGKELRIIPVANAEEARRVHILFVSRSEERRSGEILATLADWPILTIGEGPGFNREGGIVRLFVRAEHLQMSVNQCAAHRAGLRISSRMLRLVDVTCPRGGE